jgi:3D (Asp-Asp-Asp) domain-containing protein
MKILTSLALAASALLLSSCGNDHSIGSTSGIHTRSISDFKSPFSRGWKEMHPKPVSATALKRTRGMARDKHGMPTYSDKVRNRVVRTTAYSHEEMEVGAPWRKNALGTYLKYGSVRSAAADWSKYPVGTRFKIKGLPYTYVVDDYGSALAGTNTIDIYHPNLASMRRWGTRHAEITVVRWGDWERTLNILSKRTHYPHTRQMYYAARAKVASGRVARN